MIPRKKFKSEIFKLLFCHTYTGKGGGGGGEGGEFVESPKIFETANN